MTTNGTNAGTTPLRIFIFDGMRTRSHLLFRWLLTHPDLRPLYHPYLWARYLGAERHTKYLKNSEAATKETEVDMVPLYGHDTCETCSLRFEEQMKEIEARGKICVSNEHVINILRHDQLIAILRDEPLTSVGNPTYLPDPIYNSITPIVLTRNPIIHIESLYKGLLNVTQARPGDETFAMTFMFAFARHLYDQLRQQGRKPIVIDAEDMLWRTQEVGQKLCTALGIENVLSDKWEKTPEDQRQTHPAMSMWVKDIEESEGMMRPATKPAEPDLPTAFKGWEEKYGLEVAQQLRECVKANTPHYEYLTQFKI